MYDSKSKQEKAGQVHINKEAAYQGMGRIKGKQGRGSSISQN